MDDNQDIITLIENILNEYKRKMYKATNSLELKASITKQYATELHEFIKTETITYITK